MKGPWNIGGPERKRIRKVKPCNQIKGGGKDRSRRSEITRKIPGRGEAMLERE